ncbi:MAG: transporter substrate-binding domain-containing protein [Wenzhouxiangellaceae bacterium]|nr:transporter substrate-binding domain-containing protein [Wenzhouxiangellaceae bacterium]
MHAVRILIAVAGAWLACLSEPVAAQAPTEESAPLKVAVRVAPPFVVESPDGELSGISVWTWRRIAERLDLDYEFVPAGLDETLEGTAAGRFDVGVGAFNVTAEREQVMDFSHAFHSSGYGIAVRAEDGGGWLQLAGRFLSLEFLTVAVSLAGLLLFFGVLAWWFERRANPEEFDRRPGPGIGSGFWWAAVTMTTVGYGDKSPKSLGGRIVAFVWMFAAIIVISSFTAAITSSLTVSRLSSDIQGMDDLRGLAVGTVAGSASAAWLDDHGFRRADHESLDAALDALAEGRIRAVFYDAPLLRYRLSGNDLGGVRVLPQRIERLDYAFLLPENSALREPLNRALLETLGTRGYQATIDTWLGED